MRRFRRRPGSPSRARTRFRGSLSCSWDLNRVGVCINAMPLKSKMPLLLRSATFARPCVFPDYTCPEEGCHDPRQARRDVGLFCRYAPLAHSPRPNNGPLSAGRHRVAEGARNSYELCCEFK